MKTRYLFITPMALFVSLLLIACQPLSTAPARSIDTPQDSSVATNAVGEDTQPPELPNLLVRATSNVEVRRIDSAGFIPIALGAEVEPGDVLSLAEGEAAIFCGAETEWPRNPLALSTTNNNGVPCGVGRPPRPYPDAAMVRSRGGEEATESDEIYILSPRSGWVLNDRPTLVWHEIADASSYTVTLESDDSITRTTVADSSPLAYPDDWAPLEGLGASYRLIVETADVTSGDKTPGFSLLEDQESFQDKVARLQERVADEPARTLLLAEFYLSHSLRSEAIDLLNALADRDEMIAVQGLLGETYLNMGLVAQGQAAYTKMAELAKAQGFVESQAQAAVGLGWAACALRNTDSVSEHWMQAHALYDQHSLSAQAAQIQTLLTDIQKRCG